MPSGANQSHQPLHPERDALIEQMWREGFSVREIAAQFGVSRNTIIGRARRMKLGPHPADPCLPPPPLSKPELDWSGCLWPFGDPGKDDFHFCAATKLLGKSWCAEHFARAYARVDSAPKRS